MNKILFLTLVTISSLTLSACSVKDQVKTKVLNKVEQKIIEEKLESQTDEQLLKELGTDDTSLDADLKALETDLQ